MDGHRGGSRASRRRRKQRRRLLLLVTAIVALVIIGAVAGVALVLGPDDDTSGAGDAARTTSSSSNPTTTTSSTTTVPVSTTIVAKSPDPVVALAQQYDGRYVGTFTNTTFGTTGAVTLEIRIDPATGELASTTDFDGDLFGGGAKAVRRISGTVKLGDPNATITTETEAFGPVTGRVDESLALVLSADDVPGSKVKGFTLTGRLRADLSGFDATYTVAFEDGTTAEGTVAVSCDPAGSRPNEVSTICALSQGGTPP